MHQAFHVTNMNTESMISLIIEGDPKLLTPGYCIYNNYYYYMTIRDLLGIIFYSLLTLCDFIIFSERNPGTVASLCLFSSITAD